MKKSMLLKGFVLTLILLPIAMVCVGPSQAKPILIRMVTDWPVGERVTIIQKHFIDEIVSRTGDRVKIEMYPGGQLIKADEHPGAISSGMVEMACTQLSEAWPTVVPELTITGITVFNDSGHAFRAYDGPLGSLLAKGLEKKANAKLLAFTTAGDVDALGSKKKQIKTPADLHGLKLRVSSQGDASSCEALGGIPVVIAGQEMYMALQRGTVDGVFITSTYGIARAKLYEVCKYWTRISLIVGAQFGFVINLDTFRKLPEDIQKVFQEAAQRAREAMLVQFKTNADKDWATTMPSYPGVEIYQVPAQEISQWKDKMIPANKKLLEKAVGADEAKNLLDLVTRAR